MAPGLFARVECVFVFLFLAEYLVRLWAEGESPRFRRVQGRIRYALTPGAIVDLIAFLPSLVLSIESHAFAEVAGRFVPWTALPSGSGDGITGQLRQGESKRNNSVNL